MLERIKSNGYSVRITPSYFRNLLLFVLGGVQRTDLPFSIDNSGFALIGLHAANCGLGPICVLCTITDLIMHFNGKLM